MIIKIELDTGDPNRVADIARVIESMLGVLPEQAIVMVEQGEQMTAHPDGMTLVDGGVHEGIEWATCKAPVLNAVNGYVRVPEGHPWHGLDYDSEDIDVEVNGGLTYSSGDGWIGFDCLHLGDWWPGEGVPKEPFAKAWTPELVAAETRHLASQVAKAGAR